MAESLFESHREVPITVPTVIAGQVKPIRTTVEQPCAKAGVGGGGKCGSSTFMQWAEVASSAAAHSCNGRDTRPETD